jgi:hypothetical protein
MSERTDKQQCNDKFIHEDSLFNTHDPVNRP